MVGSVMMALSAGLAFALALPQGVERELPEDWQAKFWSSASGRAFAKLEPKAAADLTPVQSGIRHCRCPVCDAGEDVDPLTWSVAAPKQLLCRHCGRTFPSADVPAKVDGKIPEETIEVLPGVWHRYPYHQVDASRRRFPDERLYLDAKRDYEARAFLAKAALYAAVRAKQHPDDPEARKLALLSATIILRFAQVYPSYAAHQDLPNQPKLFFSADLRPPYRRGYQTGKWDALGCWDVPLPLVKSYMILGKDPVWQDAGALLDDPHPLAAIERFFRSAAQFVRSQPEEFSETSLHGYRGMLTVGEALGDPELIAEARTRVEAFTQRGFHHDGFWRRPHSRDQRRVLSLLEGGPGWLGEPLKTPILALARSAVPPDLRDADVRLAGRSPQPLETLKPALFGGASMARLTAGRGADALALELRGFGSLAGPNFGRLAIRLKVGGREILGDLDDGHEPSQSDGWSLTTASHNGVLIDGRNQRETLAQARQPAPGADILFYAADPDFQIAVLDDRRAYPQTARTYRHTIAASTGKRSSYAVSVFEVQGGHRHEQIFHSALGPQSGWTVSAPLSRGPENLLPAQMKFVANAKIEDGRWFAQFPGLMRDVRQGWLERSGAMELRDESSCGVKLHVLGDPGAIVRTCSTPDPQSRTGTRASLLLSREQSEAPLTTRFVTVFEPVGPGIAPLRRVGRVESEPDVVVLAIEGEEGLDHLVLNLRPGAPRTIRLSDGQVLETDGAAVRRNRELLLAGGTFARIATTQTTQPRREGEIRRAARDPQDDSLGWFETDERLAQPHELAGRALLIRHGDGSWRGWTLARVEPQLNGGSRLVVVEEPGFRIEERSGRALQYQFPGATLPGPHRFRICCIAR